ncbi:MAG: NAD-dependent epimerase/dehydratase family protein, partial [Acidobacteria bacterium]
GGNRFNIAGIESKVTVSTADIRDEAAINQLVVGRDVIFNLAGQVSHIDSMRDPKTDLDINCRSQLTLLEACRRHHAAAKVVYAGTRQIYGKPDRLPVDETHLVRPTDINGINKAAGEQYHLVYNNALGVRACSLRLTNVYGPRQLIRHNRQGFIGWFIRLAVEGGEIQVYGDGSQLRDFVHVDDVVDAFLRAGATDTVNGQAFNVGSPEPVSHRELVTILIEEAGRGSVKFIEWPEEKRRIDIGSFYSDSTKFTKATGWSRSVPLRDGLRRTIEYYRANLAHYLEPR